MKPLYTVALQHCAAVPPRLKTDAEARFAGELERVLGGAEYVAETFAAWDEINQSDASHIDKHTAARAARWRVAMYAATQAGFSGLSHVGQAHFTVRLEHRQARAA
jgi:hypothetical protein